MTAFVNGNKQAAFRNLEVRVRGHCCAASYFVECEGGKSSTEADGRVRLCPRESQVRHAFYVLDVEIYLYLSHMQHREMGHGHGGGVSVRAT